MNEEVLKMIVCDLLLMFWGLRLARLMDREIAHLDRFKLK